MSNPPTENTFTDLSGTAITTPNPSGNPYTPLLSASDSPPQIQHRYQTHRATRNLQQKATLLSPTFHGFTIDPILTNLLADPTYIDPRNCLVFWARPPPRIKSLVHDLQQRLLKIAPSLWLMPLPNLHLTTLEITHSQPPAAIPPLLDRLTPHLPTICTYPCHPPHRARLVQPQLSYDAAAIALSFVPAAGEPSSSPSASVPFSSSDSINPPRKDTTETETDKDSYTYHHLRHDLWDLCSTVAGVSVASRYVVPSAHLTIARFVDQGLVEEGRVGELVKEMEGVNRWLRDGGAEGGEWVVGEGKGLVCRVGRVWYGGGESAFEGEGF